MNNLQISKKGKTPSFLLFTGIFMLVISFAAFAFLPGASTFGETEFQEFCRFIAPIICLLGAIALLTVSYRASKTYINIFYDHIEGYVLSKKGLNAGNNIYLNFSQFQVTCEQNNKICISTPSEQYFIFFSESDAKEIYSILNSKINQNPNNYTNTSAIHKSSTENTYKTFYCVNCGTGCRIHSGKGHIRINCPNCHQQFDVNS